MVEILVVAAIVIALVGVAVPVSLRMMREGNRTKCLGKLRNIGVALESYLADNNNRFPEIEMMRSSPEDPALTLETVLLPYVEGPEAFHCPADREEFEKTGSSYLWNSTQSGRHRMQTSFFGMVDQPNRVPLVLDKESYHNDVDGVNMLYADYHLSNKVEFRVGAQ